MLFSIVAVLDTPGQLMRPCPIKKTTPLTVTTAVGLPNGNNMRQSHLRSIPIHDVPSVARPSKVYRGHSYKAFLSLGQFGDTDYLFLGSSEKN